MSVLGAIALIAGCAQDAIIVSNRAGIEGVAYEGKTVVLFRLLVTKDGQSQTLSDAREPFDSFEFGLAHIEADEQMKPVTVFSPSSMLKSQGWMYALAEPGRYQLWVVPPTGSWGIFGSQDTRTIPDIHFHIPPGVRWMYAGTFDLDCSRDTGFWGNKVFTQCADTPGVINEARKARRVIEQVAQRPVSFMVRLGVPHRWKTVENSRLRAATSIIQAQGKPIRWIRPDWRRRALERVGVTPQGVGRSMWGLGGISTIAYLLYLPFGILTGELWGASDQETWGFCLDRWQEALQREDFQRQWNRMIHRALSMERNRLSHDGRRSRTVPDEAEPSVFVWTSSIERMQLRECEQRGSFCLELAVRLQIRERSTEQGQLVYDGFLLYSNPAARPEPFSEQPFSQARLPFYRTYEILLPARAPCRNLEFYCADGHAALLRDEVNQALSQMIGYFLTDLGITAETSQTDR